MRILRDTGAEKSDCIYVDSMEEAIEYLEQTTGNILATTGSKELAAFQNLTDYKKTCLCESAFNSESGT